MIMTEEVWRDIKGYEGLYQISNMGRVKSLDRFTTYTRKGKIYTQYTKGRILKTQKDRHGYLTVSLCINGKSIRLSIARIVAEAFIPNPDNKPCVDHIDTNPLNNTVVFKKNGLIDYDKTNLKWCTQKENMNNPITKINLSNSAKNRRFSEETRKKMSKARKGRKVSEETRKKMSDYHKGRMGKLNNHSRPVLQFDLNGDFIKEWDSIIDAKKETGATHIIDCCKGIIKKSGGFIWKYPEREKVA